MQITASREIIEALKITMPHIIPRLPDQNKKYMEYFLKELDRTSDIVDGDDFALELAGNLGELVAMKHLTSSFDKQMMDTTLVKTMVDAVADMVLL